MENLGLIKKILDKENIKYKNIEKSTSGFTNEVYFVDDKYVVKMLKVGQNPMKLEKEIAFYQNVKADYIPKYIASGKLDGRQFLIMEKLGGVSLYKIWHILKQSERENVVLQIAEILNNFHKLPKDFLSAEDVCENWAEEWKKIFDLNIAELEKRELDATAFKKFKGNALKKIFAEQDLKLVYNDAHFDNFIYKDGKIKLIDFDRVKCVSVDYELLIITAMLDEPRKFASEEDEPNVEKKDYEFILPTLKRHSSEMFDFKFLKERLFVYRSIYSLGNAFRFNDKDKIAEVLQNFEEFYENLDKK